MDKPVDMPVDDRPCLVPALEAANVLPSAACLCCKAIKPCKGGRCLLEIQRC